MADRLGGRAGQRPDLIRDPAVASNLPLISTGVSPFSSSNAATALTSAVAIEVPSSLPYTASVPSTPAAHGIDSPGAMISTGFPQLDPFPSARSQRPPPNRASAPTEIKLG